MDKSFFKTFLPRELVYSRATTAALTIFFASYVGRFFSFSESFWIPITALLVLQTAVGVTGRQGLQRFLIIAMTVIAFSSISYYFQNKSIIQILAVIIFSILSYFFLLKPFNRLQVMLPMMIGLIILIDAVSTLGLSSSQIRMQIVDIGIGSFIGLIAGLIVFPAKSDVEFRKDVVLLLNACSDYFSAVILYLFDHGQEKNLQEKKIQLENNWELFPDWVYESGFTLILQQGHRHFVVRLDEIRQIIFGIDYLAHYPFDKDLINQLEKPVLTYSAQLQKLINDIVMILTDEKISHEFEDISEGFMRLEKKFKTIIPYSLEALEINREYVYLANLIYELKELGRMLHILSNTLRV